MGSAADIDHLLVLCVFKTVYTNLTSIENVEVFSFHTDFRPKISPKIGNFVILNFLDISARSSLILKLFRPAICTIIFVPWSVLPVFKT